MTDLSPRTIRSARRLRLVTLAGIALLALILIATLWVAATGRMDLFGAPLRVDGGGLPPRGAAGAMAVLALLLILALRRLVQMLRLVEANRPFATAGALHGFALWLFATVLASVLLPPILHAALGGGDGARHATFTLSGDQALMLLVTGLLFFVSRLLDEAQRLADDHDQIV
ncbi:MAG TPA: hypothetical protein VEW04_05195 [Allosphingosinicella sp.]|nr:hypothetical protein [Allosphingosinicella sp.]